MVQRMSKSKSVILTRDNFLDLIGVPYVNDIVHDKERLDKIYEAIAYYASRESTETIEDIKVADGFQFKVPKLPIHFNLTKAAKEGLKNVVTAGLITTAVQGPTTAVTSIATGLILTAAKNVSVLERKNGESCIIESLAERKTGKSSDVFNDLSARDCRHPKSGCVFFDKSDGFCAISLESIIMNLAKMEEKNLVSRVPNVPSIQWKVVL